MNSCIKRIQEKISFSYTIIDNIGYNISLIDVSKLTISARRMLLQYAFQFGSSA